MPTRRELASEATGPLKGVRVVDMTSVVFGAYATQMLGDLGADVIKVEFPGGRRGAGGDTMRWTGRGQDGGPEDLGPIFITINRNKRSLVLDLREEKAKTALRRLIGTADVFAASVRYEGLGRLGLDYEGVKAIKPDIVYVHAAGYGAAGPYAGEPAYDDLIQSAAGLADLIGRVDGDPTPRLLPTLVADKVSGLFMANAVTAALFHHQRTGEGQFVEVPMMECLTTFTLAEHFFGHVYDPPTGPWAYPRVTNPKRKPSTDTSACCPTPTTNGTSSSTPPAGARPSPRTRGSAISASAPSMAASCSPWSRRWCAPRPPTSGWPS